jgi:hypothetical protein
MKALLKPFPQPTTLQPMQPNRLCELQHFLDQFHQDLHWLGKNITGEEVAKSFAAMKEIINRYARHLTLAEWISVLGELVVGTYMDPDVVVPGYQAISPFAASA